MKKIVSLFKLYIPKTYSSIWMLVMMGLALFFNIISIPCEQQESATDYSFITANSYICLNEEFHRLFINFNFIIPLILVTLFISINANYFLLAFHYSKERISLDLQTNEYLKDLTLLSSVGIPKKTLFNGIFIFKGLFILLTVFILNLSRLIIFFRTSIWTGITFKAFVLGILLAFTVALLIHIIMLNSPTTNLLCNIFSVTSSVALSFIYILGGMQITSLLYHSLHTDQALVNNILGIFNTTQTSSFTILMLLSISAIIVLSIIYILKNYNNITTFKSIINIKAKNLSSTDKIFKMIFIILGYIVFFSFVIILLPNVKNSFLNGYLIGLLIYQLVKTIRSIKTSKNITN